MIYIIYYIRESNFIEQPKPKFNQIENLTA